MKKIERTNYIATSEMYIDGEKHTYYIHGIKELNMIKCYIAIKDTNYLYLGGSVYIGELENTFEKEFELFLKEFDAEPDLRIHMYLNIYGKTIDELLKESIKENKMKIIEKENLI